METGSVVSFNFLSYNDLQQIEPARSKAEMTYGYSNHGLALPLYAPDLLISLFLVGLLSASGSFLAMVRTAAQATQLGLLSVSARIDADVLHEYREVCAHRGRSPLLLYAYLASLFLGLGALLVALL